MKAKNCLIFSGSGQIGRNLIRKLTKNNYSVTVVTKIFIKKAMLLKLKQMQVILTLLKQIFSMKKIRALF